MTEDQGTSAVAESADVENENATDEVAELRRQLAEVKSIRVADAQDSPVEREATGGFTRGLLAEREILVPPLNKWRSSAMRALNTGDFETWAEKVLTDDDYDTWMDVDPTVDEINEFFESISDGLGVDRGNSRASRRQSGTTKKR